jgi:GTPase SAR1 family protein
MQDAEKAIKKIIIEGEAGFGKTTLCISITRDWATGKLFQQFELLLILPLHEKKLASVTSIDALFSVVYDDNTCAFIINYLERHGEKVLIIMDGWDAMPSAPEQQKQCSLYDILFGDRYPSISVLVTSRPSAALHTLPCIDQFIGLRGFNKETIKWCIQSYFPNKKEVTDNLLKQFESNPLIESVCSVPLNCAIICDMMDSNEELTLPSTMTELYYNNLILHIINNTIAESSSCVTVSSLSDLPDDLKLPWQSLCEIAFKAIFPVGGETRAHSLNLSPSDVAVDRIFDFGLVKSVSEDAEGKLTFQFYQQTITSYLAAQHLVQQPRDTQLSIVCSYASLKQLTMVWRFLFGIKFREINSISVDCDLIKQILAARHISSGEGYFFCHYSFEAKNKIVSDEVFKAFTTIKRQCPANLSLIHFGNPRTAHDCAAILYFIANIEQKTSIELNFNHCLTEKQLRELAHLLDNKQSIVQLKALDLSDNQFSDEVIVDCFMKFVSTFKFIKKLFLRNCRIGQAGMDVIITIIMLASQSLTFLDLSYNSVSLYALRDAVLSGVLSNMEIVLLQGSVVEQEDTSCLAGFSEALLSHCKYLRRLDLSANNFGDPRNPALGRIISQMTSICENFDLILDRQYMSEVEKNFIEIMEESIKKKGTIDHTIAHGVIVGPGRSGKNSLMNRLLGKGPPPPGFQSCSTGVLENVRKVEVKKLCTVSAAVSGGGLQWNELEYDEEAIELMMTTARSCCARVETVIKEGDDKQSTGVKEVATSNTDTSLSETTSQALITPPKRLKLVKNVKATSIKYKRKKEISGNLFVHSSKEGRVDIFKRALRLRYMDGLREQLESSWSLYLTNTGGQIEFQELLPLLVSGPSIFFITFPLNRNLKDYYSVQYQYKDGSIQTYPSPSTLLDELLQTLATISALNSEHLENQQKKSSEFVPKIFFVGTHKDCLPKSSRELIIDDIDSTLQNCIEKTSLFDQGSIEYACPTKRLIFTVDNLAEDDDDFQKIRLAMQLMVERSKDFTVQCPSTWLIFSLILRAKHKSIQVLTYSECFKIAQSCGISDCTELNNALFFIHARLGLVRYFSVDGLNSLVILDPQILFDKITDLIINTFIQEYAKPNEIEEFQNRGILSVATIERLSQLSDSNSRIPLDWLLKLLNYLRIAAHFKDHTGDKYFFPSVVCRAPEQLSLTSSTTNSDPSLLVAFKNGFCPRGIPGALIKYLMTNEMNSQLRWELHLKRIFKNRVTFGIETLGDIILKIHPTHLEIQFDPQCKCSQNDLRLTCSEAFAQIKQGMKTVTTEQNYFFAFYCTQLECNSRPHPAKIEWRGSSPSKLKCDCIQRRGDLPMNYQVWLKPAVEQFNGIQYLQIIV